MIYIYGEARYMRPIEWLKKNSTVQAAWHVTRQTRSSGVLFISYALLVNETYERYTS